MSQPKGLEAWLPEMKPSKGTLEPTETNTMLCEDGRYHDPNQLESYFVEANNGYGAFFGLAKSCSQAGFANLLNELSKDLYGSDS